MKTQTKTIVVKTETKVIQIPESLNDLKVGDYVQQIGDDYTKTYGKVISKSDFSLVIKWIPYIVDSDDEDFKYEYTIIDESSDDFLDWELRIATEDEVRVEVHI